MSVLPYIAGALVGGVVLFIACWNAGKALCRATADRIYRSL